MNLTEREEQILQLVCEGHSNRNIAIRLDITINTVKHHLKNIYGKMGTNSRVLAALNYPKG